MEWTVAIGVDTHKECTWRWRSTGLARGSTAASVPSDERGLPQRCWRGRSAFGEPRLRGRGVGQLRRRARSLPRGRWGAVFECERPAPASAARRQERSDRRDALAARRLLSGEGLSLPRGGGRREELRLLLLERRGAIQARTAGAQPAGRALLVTAPDHAARASGARSPASDSLARAARLRPRATRPLTACCGGSAGASSTARPGDRARSTTRSRQLVAELAPDLLDECGVGAGLRRATARLQRRPERMAQRGVLRGARRHQPGRRLQRQAATPPAQPRRRSPTQLGAPRDRPPTHPPPRRDRRLLPAPPRRPARPPGKPAAASNAHSPATSTTDSRELAHTTLTT